MVTRDFLLGRIATFCTATGHTERQLGDRAVKNPKIVARIRRGDHVTTETIERIESAMADMQREAAVPRPGAIQPAQAPA